MLKGQMGFSHRAFPEVLHTVGSGLAWPWTGISHGAGGDGQMRAGGRR